MQARDLDQVLQNESRAYAYPWTRGIFLDCINTGHECRLLELDSGPIGHGVLSAGAEEAHLLNVCIRRDQQGNGYGRQLVEHMLERGHHRGAHTVFLEVRWSNFAAIALYDSLGFREIGVRKDYYPAALGFEDARVLALDLMHYYELRSV